MQRTVLGIIALVFLACGVVGEFLPNHESQWHDTLAIGLRTGILLGVIWLALPDVQKLPWWAGLAVLVGAVAAWYLRGRFWIILPLAVVALLALLLLLRPRKRSTHRR